MKNEFINLIDELENELVEIAVSIWKNPETGYEEYFASKTLCDFLEKYDFDVQRSVEDMETAFVATKGEGEINLVFSVEYDALPNIGHACGHNIFCASGVGASVAVSKILKDNKNVKVTVIGSPAEEAGCVTNGSSKVRLQKLGLFDTASIALISHADANNVIERRLVGGAYVEAYFKGKQSHAGGSPEKGINALTAGMLTINNINAIRQQFESGNVVNPVIMDSSALSNSIPEMCDLKINIRASKGEQLYKLIDTIKNCVDAAALVTGCQVEFVQTSMPTEELTPNHILGLECKEILDEFGVEVAPNDYMNYCWDIGNISHVCPTLASYYKIGSSNLVGHTAEFCQASNSKEGYEALILSAKTMGLIALKYATNEEFRKSVIEDFKIQENKD